MPTRTPGRAAAVKVYVLQHEHNQYGEYNNELVDVCATPEVAQQLAVTKAGEELTWSESTAGDGTRQWVAATSARYLEEYSISEWEPTRVAS